MRRRGRKGPKGRKGRNPGLLLFSGMAEVVACEVVNEEGIVGEVAFPESAGFSAEAVEPFHACFLDPCGGLADFAGVEGEGGTDAEVDGWGKLVFVTGDPEFLFGAAEADPDEVGIGIADVAGDAVEFVIRPRAEGWAVGTGDDGMRVVLLESRGQFREC